DPARGRCERVGDLIEDGDPHRRLEARLVGEVPVHDRLGGPHRRGHLVHQEIRPALVNSSPGRSAQFRPPLLPVARPPRGAPINLFHRVVHVVLIHLVGPSLPVAYFTPVPAPSTDTIRYYSF